MILYIIRHGDAVSSMEDQARPLSSKGRGEVEKMASFLKPLELECREIWHSGKTRSLQTAEILGKAVTSMNGLVKNEGLSPNDPVGAIRDEISSMQDSLLIVGHLPFLDNLASLLLAEDEWAGILSFPTGGMACLEWDEEKKWTLLWFLDPALMI